MKSALEGFLREECDDKRAADLRARIAAAGGVGWDEVGGNVFDVEFFYGEGRVVIRSDLGDWPDEEITLAAFLRALPDVPPTTPWESKTRRAWPMPPGHPSSSAVGDGPKEG